MRVFLQPTGLHSIAMLRVVNALTRYKPQHVEIIKDIEASDIAVIHVIGLDAYENAAKIAERDGKYVVIQYCGCWDVSALELWYKLWERSLFTWSYYDLSSHIPSSSAFYYAPLGVDDVFIHTPDLSIRRDRILTSGYVSGRPQEPIEEVWAAASELGEVEAVHLGPECVKGMIQPPKWVNYHNIDDISLAHLYSSCQWVSAMRYHEGFELPAIEGLVRGARPICFDQPSIRHWYGDLVHYVPECDGEELIDRLCGIFLDECSAVTQAEIDYVKHKFDWRPIANGFWRMVMETYT